MAGNQNKVEAITPMEQDFTKWYTDICLKAELVDYTAVKGCVVLRPYGYAIWENITKILDGMFKATGHENVAMPLLIPESLLQKEKGMAVSGRFPHDQRRVEQVSWRLNGRSFHEIDKLLCADFADLLLGQRHRGKGGRQIGRHFDIVHADHADVRGNA